MDIEFIEGSPVAIIDGLMSEEDCKALYDFAISEKQKTQGGYDSSDYSSEDFLHLKIDGDGYHLEELVEFWGSKNVFAHTAEDVHIRELVVELNRVSTEALKLYLDELNPDSKEFDENDLHYGPIHVYTPGHKFETHVDCFEYALVFYLNSSSEFEGGELVYDGIETKILQKPGRIVIAPSNMPHQVLEVTKGIRCSMTTFLSTSKHMENNPELVNLKS